ncbi:CpaF family protein [Diplocloster agilis]|uniref:CpaF family protein n=1 Tax=Diplocloster agilis TaxID=2850323 RepID=UPI000821E18C|nr:CpaF family protein [Suonthocola fibrivorans]MCU6732234.1 CpaF family protein [Suonthocola fibrivorans]SCI37754.1 Pertussis toxin liberation protein H [uncultured Clostridium sp.]
MDTVTLRERVLSEMDLSREYEDEEVLELIDKVIVAYGRESYLSLSAREVIRREIFHTIRKLDVLQELVDDPDVTEIMVNGTACIFVERDGKITKWERNFASRQKLEDVVQQIVAKSNRMVNETNPIADARLENGARVHVVLPPVAVNGPILTIRRFPDKAITMSELIQWGSITKEAAGFLKNLVAAGYNIFISGGTGSGKTTFLNALSGYIPADERLIVIEDNAELQIQGVENLVRLEARNANVEGIHEITIRDLIRAALRMRPDRIIVGEVRGAETLDMLQAMNTGHDGSLSTGHANSPKDMFSRLETMVMMGMNLPLPAIRRQIASGIDILVHLGRLRDKSRKVLEITEVLDYQEEIRTQCLYEFVEEGRNSEGGVKGCLIKRHPLSNRLKLANAGIKMEDEITE